MSKKKKTDSELPMVKEPVATCTATPRRAQAVAPNLKETSLRKRIAKPKVRRPPCKAAAAGQRVEGQTLRILQEAVAADPRSGEEKSRALTALLGRWEKEDPGYGERVWPIVDKVLEEQRSSRP